MHHEWINWATVLYKVYPAVRDQQYLAGLIESYKNGTAVPPVTPLVTQEPPKRPNGNISPDKRKPVTVPACNFSAKRKLYTGPEEAAQLVPDPIDALAPPAVATNTTIGNMHKNTARANVHLAPEREDNWICTSGPGASSFYSNPTKVVHTLFNWYQIIISDSDLSNIKYINSLKQPELLAASIQKAF